MLWFWCALLSAVLWGYSYAAGEYVLKNGISPSAEMALAGWFMTPFFTAMAWHNGTLGTSITALKSNPKVFWLFISLLICYSAANLLVYVAIREKNATLASLVEMSYPIFIALFAWLLFHTNQLTPGAMIGGSLIAAGIGVIYFMD